MWWLLITHRWVSFWNCPLLKLCPWITLYSMPGQDWGRRASFSVQDISIGPSLLQNFPAGQPKPLLLVHYGSTAPFAQSTFPHRSPSWDHSSIYFLNANLNLESVSQGTQPTTRRWYLGEVGLWKKHIKGWLKMGFLRWKMERCQGYHGSYTPRDLGAWCCFRLKGVLLSSPLEVHSSSRLHEKLAAYHLFQQY